jgi:cAMP phosphodiesterase
MKFIITRSLKSLYQYHVKNTYVEVWCDEVDATSCLYKHEKPIYIHNELQHDKQEVYTSHLLTKH